MTTQSTSNPSLSGPIVMFLSAALFGYFGFVQLSSNFNNNAGQFVLMWALLTWTLRIGAIVFAAAGVLTFASPILGNMVYALGSASAAIGMACVGVMDLMDPQHAAGLDPILAFIFAAWNGYGAWSSVSEIMRSRRAVA